jgi:hypothetical protein
MGPAFGDGVVALSRVVGPVGGDACDLLIGRDLAEQLRRHGRVAYVAAGDLDGPDLQCLLVDPEMDLAPDAALGTAMLAGVPLAFSLHLDPPRRFARTGGAYRLDVDQEMQRTLRPPMRNVHGKGLLATAGRAEVRHIPVQTDQPQQALDKPCRLPQGHAEEHLHRQAGLDGGVGVDGRSPTLARRLRRPRHVRTEPALRRLKTIAYRPMDRQRSAAPARLVVGGPVEGLVGRCVRSAHDIQLSHWIHKMNP